MAFAGVIAAAIHSHDLGRLIWWFVWLGCGSVAVVVYVAVFVRAMRVQLRAVEACVTGVAVASIATPDLKEALERLRLLPDWRVGHVVASIGENGLALYAGTHEPFVFARIPANTIRNVTARMVPGTMRSQPRLVFSVKTQGAPVDVPLYALDHTSVMGRQMTLQSTAAIAVNACQLLNIAPVE